MNKLPCYAGIKGKWVLLLREGHASLSFLISTEGGSDVTADVCLSVSKITTAIT